MSAEESEKISSGVEQLIERLRQDGVAAGRTEAEAIIKDARAEARRLLDEERAESDAHRQQAVEAIRAEREAADEALRQAARDTVIYLERQITEVFSRRLKHALHGSLANADVIRAMILEAAGKAGAGMPGDAEAAIQAPGHLAAGAENEGDAPWPSVLGISREMLKEGFTIETGGDTEGITFAFKNSDLIIDLREDALHEMIMHHLIPTFRDLLRGHFPGAERDSD